MALPEMGVLQSMSSSEQVFGRAWAYGGASSKSAAEFWRDYSKGLTHEQRLAQVRFIARMMDDQFRVPGTQFALRPRLLARLVPRPRRRRDQHHLAPHRASCLGCRRLEAHARAHARQCRNRFSGRLGAAVRRCVRLRLEGEPQKRAPARGAFEQPFGQVGGGLTHRHAEEPPQIHSRLRVSSTVFSSKGWLSLPTKARTVAV